jgi:hypothetical protein
VYEIVVGEGGPEDVVTYIDGVLLIDVGGTRPAETSEPLGRRCWGALWVAA